MKTVPIQKSTEHWLHQIRTRIDSQPLDLTMVYLGIVDTQGVVRAERLRPSIQLAEKRHHHVLGLGKRWTYFQNTRWVIWRHEIPTEEDQLRVNRFLQKCDCLVVRHQINHSL